MELQNDTHILLQIDLSIWKYAIKNPIKISLDLKNYHIIYKLAYFKITVGNQ